MFILATVSCTLVVLSLVHFLMALAANYAHIRGHDKFTDLAVNIIFDINKNFNKRFLSIICISCSCVTYQSHYWWLLLWISLQVSHCDLFFLAFGSYLNVFFLACVKVNF